ncbi:VirB8/TrbF family protein [uncultured Ruegeria sp.]|uniref:VirB8/TrbF family protein n=1 Tax=uncultured Ruegeria sp. TaxID=259304 RepID=UPI00261CE8AC|nr:VirB8/TrbF family protein [uncultured Ruegeria sp.]
MTSEQEKETRAAPDPDAGYRRARQDWDERFAGHAQAARQWRMMAVFNGVLMTIGVGFGVWASAMSKHVPYIVAYDALGRAVATTEAKTVSDWPAPVVKRELGDFVSRWRSVPADIAVLRADLNRMFSYTVAGSAASQRIKLQGRANSPFETIKTRTNAVEIITVLHERGSTWQVEWRETTRARSTGKTLGIGHYKGSFVLERAAELSPELISVNPLGIIVDHFDIQKLGGS